MIVMRYTKITMGLGYQAGTSIWVVPTLKH